MSDRRLRVTQRGSTDDAGLVAALDDPTIRVVLPPDDVRWEHQLMVVALTDLLSRVFPRIQVSNVEDVAADPRLPPGPDLLEERTASVREHGVAAPLPPGTAALTIGVGSIEEPADIHIDGAGWQSYLGREPSRLKSSNTCVPIGPLAAACRGAAHVFAHVVRELFTPRPIPESAYSSALTFATASDPLPEPHAPSFDALRGCLVGAGSVGGAAVYALARTPGLIGELAVIDPQQLDDTNPDRALLATVKAAQRCAAKVEVARDALAHLTPGLAVDPVQSAIDEYVEARAREQTLPLVLCAVDSARSRRAIQDCLPLELVNAACHPEEITVSGHVTDAGPCVCCLHMPEAMDGERIRAKLIAQATGLNFLHVVKLLVARAPLEAQHLRFIELRIGLSDRALDPYLGRPLEELWREQLQYGAAQLKTPDGSVALVPAPWVTALAGVLLAAEALKATAGEVLADFRLGPAESSPGVKYAENPYASPEHAARSRPPRWEGTECLCRSPRRLSLLRQRYGLVA